MIWSREWHSRAAPFTDALAISAYSAIGGYVPGEPETDNGLDMAMAAAYRRKTGLLDANGVQHKIDAYVAVDSKDPDKLIQAAARLIQRITDERGTGRASPASAPWP